MRQAWDVLFGDQRRKQAIDDVVALKEAGFEIGTHQLEGGAVD